LTIRKFVALSVAVHAFFFACIYLVQVRSSAEKKKPTEYVATLLSPEELQKPGVRPAQPTPKVKPPQRLFKKPSLVPKVTPPPRLPERAKPLFTPEAPVVPGEGEGTGKRVPETRPSEAAEAEKTGKGGKSGSAIEKRGPSIPGFSIRDELFDKEITESIARRDAGKAEGEGEKESPITFDTNVYKYAGYMTKLREKIESIWVFPTEAIARGIKFPQDLKIQFTIKKDGRLGEVRLIRTSGYKMLDDAALKALKDGEPYWPLPEEWGMETYTVLGHFIYSTYGLPQLR
jgi:protein TonB